MKSFSRFVKGFASLFFVCILLVSCARHSAQFYFGNYSEAERYYNEGKFEKSIEYYQNYINENPKGNLAVIAYYYIAKSYAAIGKEEEAKRGYQKIVKNYPDLVWADFSKTQLEEMASDGKTTT